MTLLITVFAAVYATVKWYNRKNDDMQLGILLFMYWGASIMWFVDAIFEYVELKSAYFTPAAEDMLNDAFLGLSAVALGLVIWVVRLLITDPKGVVRAALKKNIKARA
ncbi:MAG: hypothetical protein J6P05_02245 [Lachnospiraceae bacterium]|nr:hypothetical protein [Lachnospiraceae bacterium]